MELGMNGVRLGYGTGSECTRPMEIVIGPFILRDYRIQLPELYSTGSIVIHEFFNVTQLERLLALYSGIRFAEPVPCTEYPSLFLLA